MRWDPIIKLFIDHWKSLKDRKKEDRPDTRKITRGLPVVKWTEAFRDFIHRVIGSRHISLAYLIRSRAAVPVATNLMAGYPHAEEHGSVEAEPIARASHTRTLLRGTGYAASIKSFQRTKDGCSAFNAMISQYVGEDKWRALIKQAEDMIHNRKWKGQQSYYSLETFIGQHRTAFVNIGQCDSYELLTT
jgi:hypothetical protein